MGNFNLNKYFDYLDQKEIDKAIAYRESCIPEYIYKYVSLSDDIKTNEMKFSTLKENKIWVSSTSCLNDPYEFLGMYLDKKQLKPKGLTDDEIEDFTSFIRSVFIASFSGEMATNMPMWAHYANNHKGLCLKYKVNNKKAVKNIIYESKPIDVTKLFIKFVDFGYEIENMNYKNNNIKAIIKERDAYATVLKDMYFIKHNSWAYEDEYRIIFPKGDSVSGCNGENVNASCFGLELKEVYCGINCSKENIEKTFDICQRLNVSCKMCEKDEKEFTVFKECK